MEIKIKGNLLVDFCNYLNELNVDNIESLNKLSRDLRWHHQYYPESNGSEIDPNKYTVNELTLIKEAFRKVKARKITKYLEMLIDALTNTDDTVMTDLQIFCKAIVKYVDEHTIHKWIFAKTEIKGEEYVVPYLLYNVRYEPEHYDRDKYYYPPYVEFEIHTNGLKGFNKRCVDFSFGDIENLTIPQILAKKEIYVETEDLYNEYERNDKIFQERLTEQGKQYKCTKYAIKSKDDWYTDSFRTTEKSDAILDFFKVVNDKRSDDRNLHRVEDCYLYNNIRKCEIPVLPFIVCYNLDTYTECYCHVADIEDYVYDHTLQDKLVLPESHKNLLDILVNNSNVLRGDIINNKGNGTVVILEGPPGCGKTLTTEVYSELIEKPLYKVTAGQLGIDGEKMDSKLSEVLNRASRLGCILLIDECETFVRQRGTDLIQNAIITTFLRRIEYFDGIMFLTSNKIKDIDDAILSRCIAAIKYEPPTEANAKKIWRVLASQFELNDQLTDYDIDTLIKIFPSAVGRDIKELLKLTARYCMGMNQKLNIDAFLTCAQFRYLDVNEKFVEEWKHTEEN